MHLYHLIYRIYGRYKYFTPLSGRFWVRSRDSGSQGFLTGRYHRTANPTNSTPIPSPKVRNLQTPPHCLFPKIINRTLDSIDQELVDSSRLLVRTLTFSTVLRTYVVLSEWVPLAPLVGPTVGPSLSAHGVYIVRTYGST